MEKQMKTYEKKSGLFLRDLIEVMVDNSRSVKHFRTDIYTDIAEINRLYWNGENINLLWILRENGTYLLYRNKEHYAETLDTILSNYNKLKIYEITYDEQDMFTIIRNKNYINRSNDNDKHYTHY